MLPTLLSISLTYMCHYIQPSLALCAGCLHSECLSPSEEHVLVVNGSLAPPVQRFQLVFRVPSVQERREWVRVVEKSPAAHRLAAPDLGGVGGRGQSAVWRKCEAS